MKTEKVKILVTYVWSRGFYNQTSISSTVILESQESKKSITQAIRNWAKGWKGKGFIEVLRVEPSIGQTKECFNIAQKKFNFNNPPLRLTR